MFFTYKIVILYFLTTSLKLFYPDAVSEIEQLMMQYLRYEILMDPVVQQISFFSYSTSNGNIVTDDITYNMFFL